MISKHQATNNRQDSTRNVVVYELSDQLCPLPREWNRSRTREDRRVTKTGNKALPLWLIAPAAVAKV